MQRRQWAVQRIEMNGEREWQNWAFRVRGIRFLGFQDFRAIRLGRIAEIGFLEFQVLVFVGGNENFRLRVIVSQNLYISSGGAGQGWGGYHLKPISILIPAVGMNFILVPVPPASLFIPLLDYRHQVSWIDSLFALLLFCFYKQLKFKSTNTASICH